MCRFSKSNRFVWVVLIVNAPLQLRNQVSVMINLRSCSARTPALGARTNTSRQVLHSQTVEAFLTSICCCIDFIVRSLERLHRAVEQVCFFSSAGSVCRRCLMAAAYFLPKKLLPSSPPISVFTPRKEEKLLA